MRNICYFFFLWILIAASCKDRIDNIMLLGNCNKLCEQIPIRKWELIGPLKYDKDILTPGESYKQFKAIIQTTSSKVYYQLKEYTDLNAAFNQSKPAKAFMFSSLNSAIDQNVAFLIGIDNTITLWVNDQLIVRASSKNITKNEIPVKVHLVKGINKIVVEVSSNKDAWNFHLDIAKLSDVKLFAYGLNAQSFAKHYLLKEAQPLMLKLPISQLYQPKFAKVQLFDTYNHLKAEKLLSARDKWIVGDLKLNPGVYSCRLIIDTDTLLQKIIVGDFKNVFRDICLRIPTNKTKKESINISSLVTRFNYLHKYALRNGFDEGLERKISAVAYDLDFIIKKIKVNENAFKYASGFHIRSFVSKIDNSVNNYAVYYPENLSPGTKVPLVIIMPWVAKQNPFIESWHLAFIDHIEFLEKEAKKYGFAIMWQSARIYEQYNFTPMVPTTSFEALNDLTNDYKIDMSKIYLQGTCSGGLQALLMADRYPTLFAAVGVEGPEISYLRCENNDCQYPTQWTKENSLIRTSINLTKIPLYIANSKNDWHGAKQPELNLFINSLVLNGGHVTFDSIDNATRNYFVKMVNDNLVTDHIFQFFSKQRKIIPDTLRYSTYQLKYNKYYWLSLDDIDDGLASVTAFLKGNTIFLKTDHIRRLSLDLSQIPGIELRHKIEVVLNGFNVAVHRDHKLLKINVGLAIGRQTIRKTHSTEGPINHFFGSRFIAVLPDSKSAAMDTFVNNWRYNFFSKCLIKRESEISSKDLSESNLLLCGTHYKNPIIKKIIKNLPCHTWQNSITIGNKIFAGRNLSYDLVYPNLSAPSKYIFFHDDNSESADPSRLKNIFLTGWYDFQIFNNSQQKVIGSGYFDRNWKLKANKNDFR